MRRRHAAALLTYLFPAFFVGTGSVVAAERAAEADEVVLLVKGAPAGRLAVAHVDLTAAMRWSGTRPTSYAGIHAFGPDGAEVPFQFVPDADFSATSHAAGTAVFQAPGAGDILLRLEFDPSDTGPPRANWDGIVHAKTFTAKHDPAQMSGLPSEITFTQTGKTVSELWWNDRVYHAKAGSYSLAMDGTATVAKLADGPLCTVVRVQAPYMRPNGRRPLSEPRATYHWCYLHDSPLVMVTVLEEQSEPFTWQEVHFFELHPGDSFGRWAGGEPFEEGIFANTGKAHKFANWAAISDDGQNMIALLNSGRMYIYDFKGTPYTYLHAWADTAFTPTNDTERALYAWLYVSSGEQWDAVEAAAERVPVWVEATATVDAIHPRITALEDELRQLSPSQRRESWWQLVAARQLESEGRFDEALRAVSGIIPEHWRRLVAGNLSMFLEQTESGVRVVQLSDWLTDTRFLADKALPLFTVLLRDTYNDNEIPLDSESGWNTVTIETVGDKTWLARYESPEDEQLAGLSVSLSIRAEDAADAFHWGIRVDNPLQRWCVRRVVFPQVALADPGPGSRVFFPLGPGVVQNDVWHRFFRYRGVYPAGAGHATMSYLAAYDRAGEAGLYVAVQDPWGSTRDILAESRPNAQTVVFSFDHPAPDMDKPANHFELSGEAVLRLFRGDWFDAAVIYRDWVRKDAKWYPELSEDGREDTPLWMRELPFWMCQRYEPQEALGQARAFLGQMDVPVGFHWYLWHQIPSENDLPHFLPAKEGFSDAVAALQANHPPIYVMPYINARLWDTRDRGSTDYEFTRIGKAGATKDEHGNLYTEWYGGTESDGSPVEFAVMCPTSEVWKAKMRELTLGLFNDCGVKGVYLDCLTGPPELCFDRSHGHSGGGGHWWTEGFWRMLEGIRREKPADCMLTMESNAEPYVHVCDGCLTWNWQFDGQVPAFPAVYGGAIQFFGRAYGFNPVAALMKAGQQLVYGEQLGWGWDPVKCGPVSADFMHQVVRLRWILRRFFYAGEMARPPKLTGDIPTVTADWEWDVPAWPVTVDAVLSGAWKLPEEQRLVFLFVNVGNNPVTAAFDFDAATYDMPLGKLTVTSVSASGLGRAFSTTSPTFRLTRTFAARSARAWLIEPQ